MTEHRAQWDRRYADDYATDAERDEAYRTHQEMLTELREIFGT